MNSTENSQARSLPVIDATALQNHAPVKLPGLVKKWPSVIEAKQSDEAITDYLKARYNGRPTKIYEAPSEAKGRLFYNENADALNFKVKTMDLNQFLDDILATAGNSNAPTLYNSSTLLDAFYPSFTEDNRLEFSVDDKGASAQKPIVSIWVGNKTIASCHFDALENVALCVAGKRRFTLFPPEQISNLYPGPLYPTPGGQVISMVDFSNVDYQKYPKFAEAQKHAMVFDLHPGDGIFIPAMWWHHVEGLADLNILVNYWWNQAPPFLGKGMDCLEHAMLAIRDLPQDQKQAWKQIFDYYVFGDTASTHAHIPESGKGFLKPLDEMNARQLRAMLLNKLNR